MNASQKPLLLCTNGCDTTRPALEYGVWLAGILNTSVVLLGIVMRARPTACRRKAWQKPPGS
jgi:hypothetical protein